MCPPRCSSGPRARPLAPAAWAALGLVTAALPAALSAARSVSIIRPLCAVR